jgi:hypothetical protein
MTGENRTAEKGAKGPRGEEQATLNGRWMVEIER